VPYKTLKEAGTSAMAFDRKAHHGGAGRNVLFGDFHVEWVAEKDFLTTLLRSGDGGANPTLRKFLDEGRPAQQSLGNAAAAPAGGPALERPVAVAARVPVRNPLRIIVETDSDWYGLAISDDVALEKIVEEPRLTEGDKPGHTTRVLGPDAAARQPLAVPKSLLYRIDKPTNTFERVRREVILQLRPVPGHDNVTFRFGRGWAGSSRTFIYDAAGNLVLDHVSRGAGEPVRRLERSARHAFPGTARAESATE